MVIKADLETCEKMRPEIEPGDKLIIEKGAALDENNIFLVTLENVPMFARLKQTASGIWLRFANAIFDDVFVAPEDIADFHVIARVTEKRRSY